jgi:hypothetical protein
MKNNSIGGYLSLELNGNNSYKKENPNCFLLNTARNCLEYILEASKYKLVYIPYFTCDVILEPFKKLNLNYKFYSINEKFEPVFDFNLLDKNEAFLYTNYFGIKDNFINELSKRKINLIIDNAQSFFSQPLKEIDSFNSARKFIGVSDGAFLNTKKHLSRELENDMSFKRMDHLLMRFDLSAEEGYDAFLKNDKSLINQPIKKMSKLTESILKSVDYEYVKTRRIKNFMFLHNILKVSNKLNFDLNENQVPLVYPYWTSDLKLKSKLLNNKIYCATYWPNVKKWCNKKSLEYIFVDEIVYLPIDQRYDESDMELIIKYVQS